MDTLWELQEVFKGVAGVVTALAGLLTALVVAKEQVVRDVFRKIVKKAPAPRSKSERRKRTRLLVSITILIPSITIFIVALLPQSPPTREQLLTRAWKASNSEKWNDVVELTTKLLGDFENAAEMKQKELSEATAPAPKTGRLGSDVSDSDARNNHSRGLVNDVATALFLRGDAMCHLGKTDDARADWAAVTEFPHAVTWDERTKEFWLTKDGAENKLFQLDRSK